MCAFKCFSEIKYSCQGKIFYLKTQVTHLTFTHLTLKPTWFIDTGVLSLSTKVITLNSSVEILSDWQTY